MTVRLIRATMRNSILLPSYSQLCLHDLHALHPRVSSVATFSRRYSSPSSPISPRSSPTITSIPSVSPSSTFSPSSPKPGLLIRIRQSMRKTREMARQFITGSRVFLQETREAKELKKRNIVDGYEWTRREYFLVKRNEQDFWRAIPFVFCCIFLGEAIPFLLIRGMVPSPCLTEDQMHAKWRRLSGIRRDLATSAVQSIESGEAVPASSFLTDEFVLHLARTQPQYFHIENLTATQLRTYNKYLGIWRIGPAIYLRRVLRQHVHYIRGDDELLRKEGVEGLTSLELKMAVEARGLPSTDASLESMRADLGAWVQLHTNDDPAIPYGLMLLTGIVRIGIQGHMGSAGKKISHKRT